ncbi:MAG: TldD/PmbA family protein, partial [Proteobacteria bacterium]|nr:TldD/PmbA family protein [Pseudomonadota bacterium]
MKDLALRIENILATSPVWVEARFHRRKSQSVQVQSGLVKQAKSNITSGIGIRCLVDGAWGFSSTSDTSTQAIEKALRQAIDCAKSISQLKKASIKTLPTVGIAQGEFILDGYSELEQMPLEKKLQAVIGAEQNVRRLSKNIQTAVCAYNEQFENKIVITTDGARAISRLARNEIRVSAIAADHGEFAEGQHTVGRTGAWECLFAESNFLEMGEKAAKLAVDLLSAPKIPGGLSTLILSPAMVGLLSHEAIGHTVEADFVLSGSVAQGKIGTQVASPLITLCDSGIVKEQAHAGGDLLVDDEGIATQNTTIIKEGILNSYLHNRESAAAFGVAPTGNARAWLYQDEPLIRMRNTYILPGHQT